MPATNAGMTMGGKSLRADFENFQTPDDLTFNAVF